MGDDPIKAAEKRGYTRGYTAARKRVAADIDLEMRAYLRERFRQQAFLAAIPSCVTVDGWKRGDQPITSLDDRVRLAWDFASAACKGAVFQSPPATVHREEGDG